MTFETTSPGKTHIHLYLVAFNRHGPCTMARNESLLVNQCNIPRSPKCRVVFLCQIPQFTSEIASNTPQNEANCSHLINNVCK